MQKAWTKFAMLLFPKNVAFHTEIPMSLHIHINIGIVYQCIDFEAY